MKTDIIKISNNGDGMNEAIEMAENITKYCGKNVFQKDVTQLRLLTEEMFNMIRNIAGDFTADFWIEEKDHVFSLHLKSEIADLDYFRRKQLLSFATTGNIAHRGFLEKIHDVIEAAIQHLKRSYIDATIHNYEERTSNSHIDVAPEILYPEAVNLTQTGMSEMIYAWSMQKYISSQEDKFEQEVNDGLEKSIIAKLADDVKIGVRKDGFEIIIEKEVFSF